MSFEVLCGQCQGRLLVEQVGVVVACPHCNSHLTVGTAPDQPETPALSDPNHQETIISTLTELQTPAVAPSKNAFPSFTTPEPVEQPAAPLAPINEVPEFVPPPIDSNVPTIPEVPAGPTGFGAQPLQQFGDQQTATLEPPTPVQTTEAPVADTSFTPSQQTTAAKRNGVSNGLFMIVLSFASAMTIAVVFLLWTRVLYPSTHSLESLPDLEPKRDKNNKIAFQFVKWDAEVAPGHVLRLGEERRFGNLKVTALKVTRDELAFERFTGGGEKRDPIDSVLKLWLRFENVSEEQSIAPLRKLAFHRMPGKDFDHERANNFVCKTSEKAKLDKGEFVLMYELNTDDIWNLAGQNHDHEIPAGESVATYVATVADGVEKLAAAEEDLVWRVHFRKGYSPKNYGVTTIVEVNFDKSEIEDVAKKAKPEATDEDKA